MRPGLGQNRDHYFRGPQTIVSPLTLDREVLRRGLRPSTPRGDTKLYDAVDFALRETINETRAATDSNYMMSDGLTAASLA
jgi:hypothetical protein